jgi:hypothetical protein
MRPKTSDELKRAVILRAAGWTLSAIVAETNISASTLQRHFKAHSVGRGTLSTEAVDEARQKLLDDAGFIDNLKHQIAASIVDDLALARQIRESLALSLEELADDPTTSPTMKARALAAIGTTAKITQDIQRKALRMNDSSTLNQVEELPELTIHKMGEAEIEAIRNRFDDDDGLE